MECNAIIFIQNFFLFLMLGGDTLNYNHQNFWRDPLQTKILKHDMCWVLLPNHTHTHTHTIEAIFFLG